MKMIDKIETIEKNRDDRNDRKESDNLNKWRKKRLNAKKSHLVFK
jgi:hypothetical protein